MSAMSYVLMCLVPAASAVLPAVANSGGQPLRAEELTIAVIAGNGQDGYGGTSGKAVAISMPQPFGLTIGPDGGLYVCEVGSHVVRRIDLQTGETRVVAGIGRAGYSGDGGPAIHGELNEPYEVRFNSQGDLLFVEMQNHLVRRVDQKTGTLSTVAGTGEAGFAGDSQPANQARLNRPHSIAFDAQDNLYICDIGNHRIRRVDAVTNIITTFAGTGERKPTPDGAPIAGTPLNGPRALDFDGHDSLYLALREGNAIYRLDLQSQTVHHQAGTGKSGYEGDGGSARTATMAGPKGISVAKNGDVYFADTENHSIRVIRKDSGQIETVAGTGKAGNGPSGPARQCLMDRPHGVFISPENVLYIGDSNNHVVRQIQLE